MGPSATRSRGRRVRDRPRASTASMTSRVSPASSPPGCSSAAIELHSDLARTLACSLLRRSSTRSPHSLELATHSRLRTWMVAHSLSAQSACLTLCPSPAARPVSPLSLASRLPDASRASLRVLARRKRMHPPHAPSSARQESPILPPHRDAPPSASRESYNGIGLCGCFEH